MEFVFEGTDDEHGCSIAIAGGPRFPFSCTVAQLFYRCVGSRLLFRVCGLVKEFWFELENTAEIACDSQFCSDSIECKTEIKCVCQVAGDVGPAMSGVRREGEHCESTFWRALACHF